MIRLSAFRWVPPFAQGLVRDLRVLERAGLVEQGRQAQWRPRRLLGRPLKEAADWLSSYRPFWEAQFDRMGEVLERMKAEEPPPPAPKARRKPSRRPTNP